MAASRFNLSILSTKAGQVATIGGLVLAVWLFVFPLLETGLRDTLRNWLDPASASACVSIPASGHIIESAASGEWATVTWRNIERHRDCGAPELTAIVVNGDGIFHDVELSTTGVKLDQGITPEIRYRFRIPDSAKEGSAWFRVTLDFHEQARTINSPRIFFTILPRRSEQSP